MGMHLYESIAAATELAEMVDRSLSVALLDPEFREGMYGSFDDVCGHTFVTFQKSTQYVDVVRLAGYLAGFADGFEQAKAEAKAR
jgi:hypothetical protein